MQFQIIESSSSGNSAFFEADGVKILIDAGVGIKKIKRYLDAQNLALEDLDGVFITHEHSDHFQSLHCFAGTSVKVFANRATAECIRYKDADTKKLNWQIFDTGRDFDFYGIDVSTFSIPHDTSDPVGFRFVHAGKTLVYATDLGKITNSIRDIATRADVLVLESNYCPVMLERSNRPYRLKCRIRSTNGHLSNADAISLLRELPQNVERVFLAHVSRECNAPEHIAELLSQSDLPPERLSKIEIVSPFNKSSSFLSF